MQVVRRLGSLISNSIRVNCSLLLSLFFIRKRLDLVTIRDCYELIFRLKKMAVIDLKRPSRLSSSRKRHEASKYEIETTYQNEINQYYSCGEFENMLQSINKLMRYRRDEFNSSPLVQAGLFLLSGDCLGAYGHMGTTLEILNNMRLLGESSQLQGIALNVNSPNERLKSYFKEYIKFINLNDVEKNVFLEKFLLNGRQGLDVFHFEKLSAYNTGAYNFLKDEIARKGIVEKPIELQPEDFEEGLKFMERMNWDESKWFVTIHVRESKKSQTAANAEVSDYLDSLQYIVDNGGLVVRLGHQGMTPLPNRRGFFDYANSTYKSPSLDIFFSAQSRFFIGTASGPCAIPTVFGRPILYTNNPCVAWSFAQKGRYIPQTIFDIKLNRVLGLSEMLKSPLAWSTSILPNVGQYRIKNSPQLLLKSVEEMISLTVENSFEPSIDQLDFMNALANLSPYAGATPTKAVLSEFEMHL